METTARHPGGRPSDYKPEYCEKVVEYCGEGFTLTSFCAEIDIGKETVYRWIDTHKEFRDACSRARQKMQQWWEKKLRVGIGDKNYNANAIVNVMGLLTEDFRPLAQRIELTGAEGGPLQIKRSVTDDQLLRLAGTVLEAEIVDAPKQLPTGETESLK